LSTVAALFVIKRLPGCHTPPICITYFWQEIFLFWLQPTHPSPRYLKHIFKSFLLCVMCHIASTIKVIQDGAGRVVNPQPHYSDLI